MAGLDDRIAGMDEDGLRKTLGELLAANRGTQANFDEIRQQFPIQPSNLADEIPTWGELEEGGLEPPEGEESFAEQLQEQLEIPEIRCCMAFETGGIYVNPPNGIGAGVKTGWVEGLKVERVSTSTYYIRWKSLDEPTQFGPRFVSVFPQSGGIVSSGWNTLNEEKGEGVIVVSFTNSATGAPSGPGNLFFVLLVL